MLTGLPTHQCGQYGLAHATHHQQSFTAVQSLSKLLNDAGYHTGVVGKLHVLPESVYPFTDTLADGGRNPVSMTKKASQVIVNAGDKPFFLWFGFSDPHRSPKGFANENDYPADVPVVKFDPKSLKLPAYLPDAPEARAEFAEYYQSIARLDETVGRVMMLLEETKHLDDTLIVMLSDNGPPFPGAKTTLYDAGIHLPLLVVQPGTPGEQVCEQLVSFTDLAPTVLEWCGMAPPKAMLGKSWLPLLQDVTTTHHAAVFASHQFHEVTMYYPMRVIRTAKHKLIHNLAHPLEYPFASDLWDSDTWQGVLKRKDQLLGERAVKTCLHRPEWELYDLTSDPTELTNIADKPQHAEVLAKLKGELAGWQKRTNDPWLIKTKHE
jgi:N-sulfoglucosamine sulfohydrolase